MDRVRMCNSHNNSVFAVWVLQHVQLGSFAPYLLCAELLRLSGQCEELLRQLEALCSWVSQHLSLHLLPFCRRAGRHRRSIVPWQPRLTPRSHLVACHCRPLLGGVQAECVCLGHRANVSSPWALPVPFEGLLALLRTHLLFLLNFDLHSSNKRSCNALRLSISELMEHFRQLHTRRTHHQ